MKSTCLNASSLLRSASADNHLSFTTGAIAQRCPEDVKEELCTFGIHAYLRMWLPRLTGCRLTHARLTQRRNRRSAVSVRAAEGRDILAYVCIHVVFHVRSRQTQVPTAFVLPSRPGPQILGPRALCEDGCVFQQAALARGGAVQHRQPASQNLLNADRRFN